MNLYPHQIESLNQTKGLNRVAFYHDMGLGKTFTGAEKMKQLNARVNLVICQKSKIADWKEHFEKYYPGAACFDMTKQGQFMTYKTWANAPDGTPASKIVLVGVINYELAWRRKELLKLHDFTLMLDESSLIQNRKAKQTKFILKLQPENVILLSGTPTAGKYENLWTQAHLLGWEISEQLYQKQYVNWRTIQVPGGQFVKVVDKENPYKNVERLKDKFREHGAVFLKTEDCFELQEQTFIEINVSKSKQYTKFMKDLIVEVEGVKLVGDTNLTKRIFARQLCGMFSDSKYEAFEDLVKSTNDRLIVFYNFNLELARLKVLVGERQISIINGSEKNLEAFENCSDSITFVQYQAGAMGLNLQKSNKIIYFTPPERCELWMQSQKRIHRIGQERPCFYYKMICSGTIEEDIYSALERGVDFTDELFESCTRK